MTLLLRITLTISYNLSIYINKSKKIGLIQNLDQAPYSLYHTAESICRHEVFRYIQR